MLALLALMMSLTAVTPVAAQNSSVLLPVDENEMLILEARAERYLVSNGLIGYQHGDQVLLPLGELAYILEYAIDSDPAQGLVEGWIVDESRVFQLDVANQSVVIDGRQSGISEPCLYVNQDDIYVTSDMLARWWPIDLEIDLRGLRVVIDPRESVPLINRLEREAMWARLGDSEADQLNYPRYEARYRTAAWPFLDASVTWDTAKRRSANYTGSLLSRGDLAKLSVTGFLGYDRHAVYDWTGWLRAGRSDRDAELLGPLSATSFAVGDVTSSALPLIGGTMRGRGFTVTNRPLGSVSEFDAIDVRGDAPPGWEVELYLDGTLQDIQTANNNGHYFFQRVPLHLGLNTIRAVLYGPNGQKREDVRTYNIRSGMWKKGHLNYSASTMQRGESIVGSAQSGSHIQGKGEWNSQIELGYGLSSTTTLGAAVSRNYVEDRNRDYVQGRLLQSVGPLFLQAVGVKDLDAGYAASLSGQTRIGKQSLFLEHSEYSDYVSNTKEGSGELTRQSEARITGALQRNSRQLLNFRLRWLGEEYKVNYNIRRDYLDLYLGTGLGRMSLGHDLRYLNETGDYSREDLLGKLMLAGYLAGVRVRGEMEYDIDNGEGVRQVGVTASNAFRQNLTGQVTGRRSFLGAGATYIMGNLDWHLQPVRLGLRLGYDTNYGASVGFSASTSLVKAPESGHWVMSGRPLAGQGAAMVQAFIDRNHDGAYGTGDQPLADVGFGRHVLWQDIRTAEDGQAFLPGITANQFVNVMVDYATVEDPYLVPAYEGMTTVVHPGGVSDLAFPFHYVGEIEGVVARDHALTRPLRSIGLELLDLEGNRVATAVSEFDGFYLFQDVLPGDYLVGVVETTLRGRPFLVPDPMPVTVPPGGDYVQGPAVVLLGADDENLPVVAMAEPEPEPDPVVSAPEAGGQEMVVAQGGTGGAGGSGSSSSTGGSAGTGGSGSSDGSSGHTGGVSSSEPVVAQVSPDQSDGNAPVAGDSPTTSGGPTAPKPASTPVEVAVAAPDETMPAEPELALESDTLRSMHLIYEMLYESSLFAGN